MSFHFGLIVQELINLPVSVGYNAKTIFVPIYTYSLILILPFKSIYSVLFVFLPFVGFRKFCGAEQRTHSFKHREEKGRTFCGHMISQKLIQGE